MRLNFRLRPDRGERVRQARNHRLRKSFNSPGGRNQTSASVARHWRLASTPSPRSFDGAKGRLVGEVVAQICDRTAARRRLVSSRSILTTSPLSRPARNSRPDSNSSKDKPSICASGSNSARVRFSMAWLLRAPRRASASRPHSASLQPDRRRGRREASRTAHRVWRESRAA